MGRESDETLRKADDKRDEEDQLEKLPYPKSVFFIVSNEFCERFSYYGMRTILILYLTKILLYSEPDAKIIYHTFTMFVYFFPVFGAIIADSYLGKFRTILYLSMIYACGSVLLALTATDPIGIPKKPITIVGLLLIALGTGGIKPCVSAFGGDQFVQPQQALQLAMFFSLFYFSINAGSLISTFLTPILRNNVHCFGNDSCYPLAFAVPGVLMIVSIVIFGLGKPLYTIKEPKGNIIVDVAKCMWHAIKCKFQSKNKAEHWLDHSEQKYGAKLVKEIKALLKVLVLYIPLPIFWALYDQQGSGWTFQAVRMDGNIGFYTILPDQMQVINPLLILAFIPLFTYGVYPLLAKCNLLKSSLQRMVCGGFLAAIAFGVSAVISMALEDTYPVEPSSGNVQLRVYNPSNCVYKFEIADDANSGINISATINSLEHFENKYVSLKGSSNVSYTFTTEDSNCAHVTGVLPLKEAKAFGIYLNSFGNGSSFYEDMVAKSEDGYPKVRTLAFDTTLNITYKNDKYSLAVEAGNSTLKSIPNPGTYFINDFNGAVEFKLGGTYTIMIHQNHTFERKVTTEPNSVHMLWLLPQYFIITAAEIMFSITGLEFSYSQAPSSMKSVLQACFLLTTAFGNLIIVLIESAKIFTLQSNDFFLYTGLMVVDMLLFMFLAIKYKYVVPEENSSENCEINDNEMSTKPNGIENPSFNKENAS